MPERGAHSPLVISLDIETYGKTEVDYFGKPNPEQTVFHPGKFLSVDGCPMHRAIQTVAVTRINNLASVADWEPGDTMVFQLPVHSDRKNLLTWLQDADIIVGSNIIFDILCLRASPYFARFIHEPKLIDTVILSFLADPDRPERSLKALGPILGTHTYDPHDLKRFPTYAPIIHYNAEDSHNTVLTASALARRRPPTEGELNWYSALQWSAIRMSEAGVPIHKPSLKHLHDTMQARCTRIHHALSPDLPMTGEGSTRSQQTFLRACVLSTEADYDASDIELTKTGLIRTTLENRDRIAAHCTIPRYRKMLALWRRYTEAQSIVSQNTMPLLHHRSNRTTDERSTLTHLPALVPRIPYTPGVKASYPLWHLVPSPFKDGQGGSGGTSHGRITCRHHAHQSDPPALRRTYRSRYPGGSVLVIDIFHADWTMAAALSGDRLMASDLADGLDPHVCTAAHVYSCHNTATVTPTMRADGKLLNNIFLNGGGAAEIAQRLEMPQSTAVAVLNMLRKRYPRLREWQEGVWYLAQQNGNTVPTLPHGLRVSVSSRLEAINAVMSSATAATMQAIQLNIHSRLQASDPAHLFLNHHDALWFDVHPEWIKALLGTIQDVYRAEVAPGGCWHSISKGRVPLKLDVRSWHSPSHNIAMQLSERLEPASPCPA